MKVDKRKIISDSIFITTGNLINKFKGIIFIPVVISVVGMANYGVFVQLLINPIVITPFVTLALGMAFNRYTSQYEETDIKRLSRDYWTVSTVVFILSIFGALFLYFLSPIISKHLLAGKALNSLKLSSVLVVIRGLSNVDLEYIQSRKEFKLASVFLLVSQLIPYLGFIAGIVIKADIFFGLLLYIGIMFALVLGLKFYVIRKLKFVLPSLKILIKFIKYSWALIFSTITGGLLSKIDRYFIGYFLGPVSIGIYNIIYSAVELIDYFSVPFRKYFDVYLPKIWDKDKKNKVIEQLKDGLLYYLIISVGTLSLLVALLKPTILLILRKDFPNIVDLELIVLVIGLGMICLGTTRFYFQLIKYKEQNHLRLIFQSVSVILNIMLNYFLVKHYGIMGAGIATFISYFAVIIMCNFYLDLKIDLVFMLKFFRVLAAGIGVIAVLFFNQVENLFHLIIYIFMAVFVYIFLVLIFKVSSLKEIKRSFL